MHTLKTSPQPKVVQELLFISHTEAGTLCLMCFSLLFQVLFDSWRRPSYHLRDHRGCQCQQLRRQQPLVSTFLLIFDLFHS